MQSAKKLSLLLLVLIAAMFAAPLDAQTRNVALSWTDAQAGVFYNVYRATGQCASAPAPGFAKVNAAPVTTQSYTDADIAPGRYCYYVTAAVNTDDGPLESGPSNKAGAEGNPFPPGSLSVVVEVAISVKPDGEVVARMDIKKN